MISVSNINRYSGEEYPVMALRGAPAPYPMDPENWPLQKYLKFSRRILDEAEGYMDQNFKGQSFVGIHLRNGPDWVSWFNTIILIHCYFPRCMHGLLTQKCS